MFNNFFAPIGNNLADKLRPDGKNNEKIQTSKQFFNTKMSKEINRFI